MIIRKYYCDNCDLELKTGFGEYRYVVKDDGELEKLHHPCEVLQIQNVLGENASEELIEQRTGYKAYYLCRSCVDLFAGERDENVDCPECGSENVRSQNELVDENCPRCETGSIVTENIGVT